MEIHVLRFLFPHASARASLSYSTMEGKINLIPNHALPGRTRLMLLVGSFCLSSPLWYGRVQTFLCAFLSFPYHRQLTERCLTEMDVSWAIEFVYNDLLKDNPLTLGLSHNRLAGIL